MYLSELKIRNHPILGDVDLDFCRKDSREPYSTIVFVGENGAGKTNILQELFDYSKSEYVIDKKIADIYTAKKYEGLFIRQNSVYARSQNELVKSITGEEELPIFADTNLDPKSISSYGLQTSLNNHDEGKLIVDKFSDEIISDFYENDKLQNITTGGKALDSIVGIKGKNDITKLSSGQQEIILKLNELMQMRYGTDYILFDEPETSLHPRWQKIIVSQLKEMVSSNGRLPQIFIATHSEKVLESVIDKEDTLIINLKKENNKINVKYIYDLNLSLPRPTFAELNYLVFGINSFEFHNLLLSELMEVRGRKDKLFNLDRYIKKEYKNDPKILKSWINEKRTDEIFETLPIYIRHYFHHPRENESVNEEELDYSTKALIDLIKKEKVKIKEE